MNASTLHTAALQLARRGVPVFPCEPQGKRPIVKHGLHDATIDVATIDRWWTRTPDANLAVPTGLPQTFDVLDVDVTDSGTGFAALRRLKTAGLTAGAFRIVATPRGGLHLWFRPTGTVRNTSMAQHHLDVRGTGGYVLVTPSSVNGREYRVIESRPEATGRLDWDACRRLLCPPLLGHPTKKSASWSDDQEADTARFVRWVAGLQEGGRNSGLFWAACQALESTGGRADLRPLIEAAVSAGLTPIEAGRTASSAYRRVVGAAA